MSAPIVLLGVSGSIAAYKAADIASQLVKHGADVRVIMTAAAERFITPLTLQTLSRNEVVRAIDPSQSNWKPVHIALADRADLLLMAPATANLIAELAIGLASHPLTEIALACRAPLYIAPAMNGHMWLHPATQQNVASLRERGAHFIGPDEGSLACGYEGIGRLSEPADIVAAVLANLRSRTLL
ncbi:MAG: Coenzyme biosynthesis bifunctional protein CoaBC [Verrucomicrobiota bacterium]|jgi:phosphopantothenoylcysteine decarboxylase